MNRQAWSRSARSRNGRRWWRWGPSASWTTPPSLATAATTTTVPAAAKRRRTACARRMSLSTSSTRWAPQFFILTEIGWVWNLSNVRALSGDCLILCPHPASLAAHMFVPRLCASGGMAGRRLARLSVRCSWWWTVCSRDRKRVPRLLRSIEWFDLS